jgi:hypothetical protein
MNTLKILMLSLFLATSVSAIEKLNNETLAQRIKNKNYQNIKNWLSLAQSHASLKMSSALASGLSNVKSIINFFIVYSCPTYKKN